MPFILQSLILLGTIIAMNFSVTQLRAMVSNSPWVPSTPLQVSAAAAAVHWFIDVVY